MQIRFEMLGVLQRLAGSEVIELDLQRSVTIADALDELGAHWPALRGELVRCAVAIGDSMVLRRDPVTPGATLALLPPVAGG